MATPASPLPHTRSYAGFKHFFMPQDSHTPGFTIPGIGLREPMNTIVIDRPHGTGDYFLLMLHDPAMLVEEGRWCNAGTMAIWPPGKPQFYGNRGQPYGHSWIHCKGEKFRRIFKDFGLPVLQPFPVSNAAIFEECLLAIHEEIVSQPRPDMTITANLLENCLRAIARSLRHTATAPRVPEKLLAVRRYIGANSSRDIPLEEMARMAGMSVPYFSALFKQTFKLSPVKCLIQHRMLHAAHLLAEKDLTVSEVAAQVGYDDAFHFSKMFKKHFGSSPRFARRKGAE